MKRTCASMPSFFVKPESFRKAPFLFRRPVFGDGRRVFTMTVLLILFMLQGIFCIPCVGQSRTEQGKKEGYYIGFASYYDARIARSEVGRLKERGYKVSVEKTGEGRDAKYHILAGPYPNRAQATAGACSTGSRLKPGGMRKTIPGHPL